MVSAWRAGYFFLHGNSVVNLRFGLWDDSEPESALPDHAKMLLMTYPP
jgi:hypothetical protein